MPRVETIYDKEWVWYEGGHRVQQWNPTFYRIEYNDNWPHKTPRLSPVFPNNWKLRDGNMGAQEIINLFDNTDSEARTSNQFRLSLFTKTNNLIQLAGYHMKSGSTDAPSSWQMWYTTSAWDDPAPVWILTVSRLAPSLWPNFFTMTFGINTGAGCTGIKFSITAQNDPLPLKLAGLKFFYRSNLP